MFERFTDRARRVMVFAQEEARHLNHDYIGTEHLLLGLIKEGDGVAARALVALGVSLERAREQVHQIIGVGQRPPHGHIPFTPRAKKVLELAMAEAQRLGHNYIGTEHLLLALLREGEGVGAKVLVTSGADLGVVRRKVVEILDGVSAEERERAWTTTAEGQSVHARAEYEDVVGGVDKAVAATHKSPTCPRCGSGLERTARTATLEVPEVGGEGVHQVRFVFCSACGDSLLASDA